jgi:NAD(P)-dependent dehydrogenase (short-subunit alcohol dehydrogenase family)
LTQETAFRGAGDVPFREQRMNRAALPQLRRQGHGLVIWVSRSSSAGGTPPYLAPSFAAKAAMDALAVGLRA